MGKQVDSDVKTQFSSYWNTGNKDEAGDILLYIGIAMIIIGLIMIVNIFRYYKPSENSDVNTNEKPSDIKDNADINTKQISEEENNQRLCTNCGEKIIAGNKFCGSCGAKIE